MKIIKSKDIATFTFSSGKCFFLVRLERMWMFYEEGLPHISGWGPTPRLAVKNLRDKVSKLNVMRVTRKLRKRVYK